MRNLEQKRGKEDCSPPDEYTLLPRTSYHEEDLCPPAVPFLQGTVSKTPGLFSTEVPRPAITPAPCQHQLKLTMLCAYLRLMAGKDPGAGEAHSCCSGTACLKVTARHPL